MEKLSYALIGCGRISPNHIIAAHKNGLKILAVCDIVESNAREVLTHLPLEFTEKINIYTDYSKMLSDISPNLVAIATESGSHYKIGMDCINAGCHVIIEKPIALDLEHADNLIKAAKKKKVKLCACHQNRFNKSIQKVREVLEAGKLGEIMHGTAHVRWNRRKDYYDKAKWRGTWLHDGGALMNQCIHNIDLLRWMMGDDIVEVFAYTDNQNHPYIETEDFGIALIKFSSGAYGLIEGTVNVYPSNLEETLYLFGKTGTVKVGGKSVNRIDEWRFADGKESPDEVKALYSEDPPNVYGYGHNPLYADVIDAIKKDKSPYIDGDAGKRALELILAIYKSAQLGEKIKFPLIKGSTLEFR